MIVVSGTIAIDPIDSEVAQAAARAIAEATRQEEGCLSYAFYSDLERPGVYRVFEEWESLAALQNHFETEHMKAFREVLAAVKVLSRDIKRYEVTEIAPL